VCLADLCSAEPMNLAKTETLSKVFSAFFALLCVSALDFLFSDLKEK